MTYFWIALVALVVAFFAVIIIRALRFKPKATAAAEPVAVEIDEQAAISHFADMIRCKTVSYYEDERIDKAEFAKFRALLKNHYPNVSAKCTYEEIGPSGVLFSLKGKSSENPAVFMSHYDVVPVNEDTIQIRFEITDPFQKLIRTSSAGTPAAASCSSVIWRWVLEAGLRQQVRASATWVSMAASFSSFMKVLAASRPPARRW